MEQPWSVSLLVPLLARRSPSHSGSSPSRFLSCCFQDDLLVIFRCDISKRPGISCRETSLAARRCTKGHDAMLGPLSSYAKLSFSINFEFSVHTLAWTSTGRTISFDNEGASRVTLGIRLQRNTLITKNKLTLLVEDSLHCKSHGPQQCRCKQLHHRRFRKRRCSQSLR